MASEVSPASGTTLDAADRVLCARELGRSRSMDGRLVVRAGTILLTRLERTSDRDDNSTSAVDSILVAEALLVASRRRLLDWWVPTRSRSIVSSPFGLTLWESLRASLPAELFGRTKGDTGGLLVVSPVGSPLLPTPRSTRDDEQPRLAQSPV